MAKAVKSHVTIVRNVKSVDGGYILYADQERSAPCGIFNVFPTEDLIWVSLSEKGREIYPDIQEGQWSFSRITYDCYSLEINESHEQVGFLYFNTSYGDELVFVLFERPEKPEVEPPVGEEVPAT